MLTYITAATQASLSTLAVFIIHGDFYFIAGI